MKAVVYERYGSPANLHLQEIDRPLPKEDEVLIRVHAATVNRTDCAILEAKPFFMRFVTGLLHPEKPTPGTEFAGEIAAVGEGVASLKVGERVFGFYDDGASSQAEYLCINETYVVTIPEGIAYEQAAASSEGAHYAYNFIKKVELREGSHVLVNGATGAIGSAALQQLHASGIRVTAVCNGKNAELVRSLGAERVIDYTTVDFTQDAQKYDAVFDTVGKSSFFRCRRLLKPGGVYISSDLGYLWQNLLLPLVTPLISPLIGHTRSIFPTPSDIRGSLLLVQKLIEEKRFRAVIDRRYPLEQIAEAYRYVELGHKKGSVVISLLPG